MARPRRRGGRGEPPQDPAAPPASTAPHRGAIGIERADAVKGPASPDTRTASTRRVAAPPPPVVPAMVDLGGRFTTAASALVCYGNLVAAHREGTVRICRSGDGAWWITLPVELDIGRAAVEGAGGQPFVRASGRYLRVRGIAATPANPDGRGVDAAALAPLEPLELVVAAGLRPARSRAAVHVASIVLPGLVADAAMRRAIDLGLDVRYRPVRLTSLLAGEAGSNGSARPGDGTDGALMTRIDVRAGTGQVPPMLLAALERLPLALVARPAVQEGTVLIQHRLASPLADVHFAALAPEQGSLILADAAFGCWHATDLADPQPGSNLVTEAPGYRLIDQVPVHGTDPVQPATVTLVRCRSTGQRTDALLLDDADIQTLTLLLEGHPLADVALIIPGAEQHLVLAPGGLLDSFAVGRMLTCIGPGLLYVPTGSRLSPQVPPSARQRLFKADTDHAVVVLEGHGLRYPLGERRPLWSLWGQFDPEITEQLPGDSVRRLLAIEQPPAPAAKPRNPFRWRERAAPATQDELLAEALAAEAADDLERAAALHRRLGDALRAGRLYERAALKERERQGGNR